MDDVLTARRVRPEARPNSARPRANSARTWTFVPAIIVLVGSAWLIGEQRLYTPGSRLGYDLGVAGGLMMLALLLYPLRKRVRFMHSWGAARHWFRIHMLFGIGGPTLILLHSTFHIGSMNAAVALFSMLIVAGSGVIGRVLHARVHHGLYGRKATLQEQQAQLTTVEGNAAARLRTNPRLIERLQAFESYALAPRRSLWHGAARFMTLWAYAGWTRFLAARDWRLTVKILAPHQLWTREEIGQQRAQGERLIRDYVDAVQSVAHFATYERLLSLWHVLHVPLVYMLVFTAVFHVIAVHMY